MSSDTYNRAQERFKQLVAENATFHCPICEQDIPVANLHTHFSLNGFAGCENKYRPASEFTKAMRNAGRSIEDVRKVLQSSVEYKVIHEVLGEDSK